MKSASIFIGAMLAIVVMGDAEAQPRDDYFRGKTLSLVVGFNTGGAYDLYARLAAAWLPKFIPGAPAIVVRNMPGAGGAKAGAFIFAQAPRDGTAIGMLSQSVALAQVLKDPTVAYDAAKFNWIGRLTPVVEATMVSRASPTKTIADAMARETVLASTSVGSTPDLMPLVMNRLVGTKFKLVRGYPGTAGGQLAMERGEVEGAHVTLENLLVERPDWLRDRLVSVLVVYANKRHPALTDTPAMVELGGTEEIRRALGLFGATAEIGRAIVAPPGVPEEQLAILRQGFDAMVADAGFRTEIQRAHLKFNPWGAGDLRKSIEATLAAEPAVVARAIAAQAPD